MTRQHWLVDRLLSMTPGLTHTIVRPGFFAREHTIEPPTRKTRIAEPREMLA
jgi:hypothetical protein